MGTSEKAIFLEAIELSDTLERERFIETACGGDSALRKNIRALIRANDDDDHPLERLSIDRLQATLLPDSAPSQTVGAKIGSYRLVRQIGEGGFGLVFLARQEAPVKRDVALKVLKPGMGSKEVIARFDAERQAVALMDHPNIARIFDAGVTNDSLPFFVMELVRGIPITRFAESQTLSVTERLELFLDVCAAVQHAHQKGIIHRDLKPSNVMVTSLEDRHIVKVIDFGIAKALTTPLTEKTLHTKQFSVIGTPLYMSPEQADMNGVDVDTRSDVFSLGVILYELLTGVTPLDRQRFDSAGLDELRKLIREEQPVLPSKRLATTTVGRTSNDHRGDADPTVKADARTDQFRQRSATQIESMEHRLAAKPLDAASIRGDLDWIVMKALEKDRARRYESANALADDIKRFLSGRIVSARPPSTAYVLSKFARRHRFVLFTAGLLITSWIAGTAVSVWQWRKASLERNQKEEALQRIEGFTERLIQANSLIASGEIHMQAGRWRLAKQDFDDAIQRQPSYVDPWLHRGKFFVELRIWRRAADDFADALEYGEAVEAAPWWGVGTLLEWSGNQRASDRFQEKLQQRLIGRSKEMSWESLRNTLASDRGYTLETRRQLAKIAEMKLDALATEDFAVAFGESYQRPAAGPDFAPQRQGKLGPPGKPTPPEKLGGTQGRPRRNPKPLCQYITAVAQLRANNYERTIELLSKTDRGRRPPLVALHHAPIALAHFGLGDRQRAEGALERSDMMLAEWLPSIMMEDDVEMPWFDQLDLIRFNDEAHQVILGQRPDRQPFFDDMQFIGQQLLDSKSDQ